MNRKKLKNCAFQFRNLGLRHLHFVLILFVDVIFYFYIPGFLTKYITESNLTK